MRIERLIVKKTQPSEIVIRDIKFNLSGLSLIVDTTKDIVSESGNNVGKTTVIKIIDLCLGGKSVRELYYDSDTKSENKEIKDFLQTNKVQAQLTLIDDDEQRVIVRRDLFKNGKKYIGDEIYTQDEFWHELKKILFDTNEEYPTFRQLIPKFIRVSNASESSMIRYLDGAQTKDTYDTIYSFLFRLLEKDLISKRNDLFTQLTNCQKSIELLEKNQSISSLGVLEQKKELIQKDLAEYIEKRNQLSYIEDYKDELEKKRKLTSSISGLQEKMHLLDFEIETISDSLQQLAADKKNIDFEKLASIYKEAKGFVPTLQTKFEEVVAFHNQMIQNRMDFIACQLDLKKKELSQCSDKLDRLLEQKKQITLEVLDEGLLDDLNILNKKIEELSVQKGEILQSIKLLKEQEDLKATLISDIQKIEANANGDNITTRLRIFNEVFSAYCEKLYGEKYLIAYDSNWKEDGKFPITVDSLGGNVGTGKKKAIIVAFDLAYIKFAETIHISTPQFVIHDKLENTHINQIKTIFELCQSINGQYIIPILRERIDKVEAKYIESAKVLELSSEDKFFRV